MKKTRIYKIGLPDWLNELIQKGKYGIISSNSNDHIDTYKYINTHKIYHKKIKNGKSKKDTVIFHSPVIKVINCSTYTFDAKKKLIIIVADND